MASRWRRAASRPGRLPSGNWKNKVIVNIILQLTFECGCLDLPIVTCPQSDSRLICPPLTCPYLRLMDAWPTSIQTSVYLRVMANILKAVPPWGQWLGWPPWIYPYLSVMAAISLDMPLPESDGCLGLPESVSTALLCLSQHVWIIRLKSHPYIPKKFLYKKKRMTLHQFLHPTRPTCIKIWKSP